MLYKTANVGSVIEQFGKYVLSKFPDEVLGSGAVKAVCARKQSDSKSPPGRHLGDYWPYFIGTTKTPAGTESIYHLLSDPMGLGAMPIGLSQRVRDVKRAILLALRGAGCQAAKDIRDANYLLRKLEDAGYEISPVRMLCHSLVTRLGLTLKENWEATIDEMHTRLSGLLPPQVDRAAFGELPELKISEDADVDAAATNSCLVQHEGRSVTVQIATIALVKGETHLATLVLEGHGYPAHCHDLEGALGSIAVGIPLGRKATDSKRSYYRKLYVATSRPSKLLCLAMNRERADDSHVSALRDAGWKIIDV